MQTGTTYGFQVQAVSILGKASEWSDPLLILAAQVPDTPNAPTTTVEGASLRVAWAEPADDGGSPIIEYIVELIDQSGDYHTTAHCTSTSIEVVQS